MNNQLTTNNLCKTKHLAKISTVVLIAFCMLMLCSCGGLGNTSNTTNTNEVPIEQAFLDSCPIEAIGFFNDDNMQIEFTNKSNKIITGWIGAVVYYDSNDQPIKGTQGNLLWGIKGNDTLAINKSSTWEYAIGVNNLVQARLYIYYVSFNDQTAWGREGISELQITTYGEKFSIQRDISNYFLGDCGLVDSEGESEKSQIVDGLGLILNLKNNSTQSIIAYEAIIIQYDVYGNKLKGTSDTSAYKTIKCSPIGFEPNKADFHTYTYYKSTRYAEVYVYYVLFEDRTSWGYREYINPTQAMEYGKKFVLDRTV